MWKKPPSSTKVWDVVEAHEIQKDGSKRKIKVSIQEIPDEEERRQEVLDLLINSFLEGEPMSKALKIREEPEGVEDFCMYWRYGLEQGITVGAYVLNETGKITKLIGTNLLFAITDQTKKDFAEMIKKCTGKTFVPLWNYFESLAVQVDVREIFKIKDYLSSISLSVHLDYRGQKLGYHLLKARLKIGPHYGFPVTLSLFSAQASQKEAKRVGFEEYLSHNFEEAKDKSGKPLFPDITSPCAKIMVMKLI